MNSIQVHIGKNYLKDASKVCNIYYEMLGIDGIDDYEEARLKEMELDQSISEILKQWKI